MALRVAQSNASAIGRSQRASSDRTFLQVAGLMTAVTIALVLNGGTASLSGPMITGASCLALLVFGLPHGSLDIALLRHRWQLNAGRAAILVLGYLTLAGAMAFAWYLEPVAALAIFLLVSIGHFAEDWSRARDPLFAWGTAAALLTAPSLFHAQMMADLFAQLTGRADASILADIALLVFPVALIIALVGAVLTYHDGKPFKAIETMALLIAMVFLPPAFGFAIFFCVVHSPAHFAAAKAELNANSRYNWREAAAMTLAAFGIAAPIYAVGGGAAPTDNIVIASFVTLSVLTVPHLTIPHVAAWWWRVRPTPGDGSL